MNLRYTPPYATTAVIYYLLNAKITKFTTDNIYEGNDFNRSGRKHVIEGTSVLQGTTSTQLNNIASALNRPRGLLEIDFGSGTYTTLADKSDSQAGSQDARNGPLPSVQVSEIIGSTTSALLVSFSFTYFSCGDTRIQRFEMNVSQSIDQNGFVKMTKSGSLVVSNKQLTANKKTPMVKEAGMDVTIPNPYPYTTAAEGFGSSPDLYRNLIVGKPNTWFVRTRQDFAIDSSLKTLTFTIEDEMVFREFSFPVMSGTASFTYERGLDGTSILGTKTFNCSFEGEKDTQPQALLAVACEASQARIDWANDLIQSIQVREPNIYGKNCVELQIIAKGQGAATIDPKVVGTMFTDPHGTASSTGVLTVTKYTSAYPQYSEYLNTTTGFKWDACLVPAVISDIVTAPVTNEEENQSPRNVFTAEDGGAGTLTPIPDATDDSDNGMPKEGSPIKHYDAETHYETIDTGCSYLETVGGENQFPFQFKLPVVIATQTVKMISMSATIPIPWEDIDEPSIVISQKISVKSAAVDASGKPTFAIVATRSFQIQTANSFNTRLIGTSSLTSSATSGGSMARRVYSPIQIKTPRNPYSKDWYQNTTTDARGSNGDGEPLDYIR